jgi:hypothetical protein
MPLANKLSELTKPYIRFITSVALVLVVAYVSLEIGVSIAVPTLIVHILLFARWSPWALNILGLVVTFVLFNAGMMLMSRIALVRLTPNVFLTSVVIICASVAITLAKLVLPNAGSPIAFEVVRPAIIFCSELPMLFVICMWWHLRSRN